MKITIELSDAEVKGIKKYMKDTEGNGMPVKKSDIVQYMKDIVSGVIHNPNEAVSDYIKQFES